jgi:transcriptional regulator with XRE-family HTH domain
MGRPAGHRLNRAAWEDLLRIKGLTLTQVAELSDVNRATLSSLLGGHHGASTPAAHRIAAAIGVQPATLFPSLGAPVLDSKQAVPA